MKINKEYALKFLVKVATLNLSGKDYKQATQDLLVSEGLINNKKKLLKLALIIKMHPELENEAMQIAKEERRLEND